MVKLFVSLAVPLLVGFAGSAVTFPAIPAWYASLVKPVFSPPNWLFGPAWTVLYVLMGSSFYLIWRKGTGSKKVRDAMRVYGIQLLVNALWSVVFFGFRSPLGGAVVIFLLLFLIAATMRLFYRIDWRAAYLLVPYFLWVSFATVLNVSVWLLNR